MFIYTKAVLNDIVKDLKKLFFRLALIANLLPILYLLYASIAKTGVWLANIILLVCALVSFFLFLYISFGDVKEKKKKEIKTTVRKTIKWIKRIVKLAVIFITGYGLLTAKNHDMLALVLFIFTVLCWALEILFEQILKAIERRIDFIKVGFKADVEPILKAFNTIKKLRGDEVHEEEISPEEMQLLDELAATYKIERKEKKAELKTERKVRRKEYRAEFIADIKEKIAVRKEKHALKIAAKKSVQRTPAPSEPKISTEKTADSDNK